MLFSVEQYGAGVTLAPTPVVPLAHVLHVPPDILSVHPQVQFEVNSGEQNGVSTGVDVEHVLQSPPSLLGVQPQSQLTLQHVLQYPPPAVG